MIDAGHHAQSDNHRSSASHSQPEDTPGSTSQPVTVAEALEHAVQLHRDGQLDAASRVYHAVMEVDPTNVDALHLSGVLAHQCGHHELALELIGFAIDREPNIADFYNNLGEVHRALGDLAGAEQCYQRAMEIDADHADAALNLRELAETGCNVN